MRRKALALALTGVLLCACGLLPACRRLPGEAETTIFAMDTVMTLALQGEYQEAVQQALDRAVERIYAYENALSATREDGQLYALNANGTGELSDDAAGLLADALELCRQTGGALDITAYPAVRAWGFTTGDYRVPDQEELARLTAGIDYTAVRMEGNTVTLPAGVELDFGAVAKGYTADRLAAQLRESGVVSALLDLGQSTILAMGAKDGNAPWRIAVQDPSGDGYLGVLELTDQAVGTSGGYQRYFEEGGARYWHIIDPSTAAPARSGLASVTVVGPSAFVCDGLSTALFVMGPEEGADFWRSQGQALDFDVIFIADDGGVTVTAGLADRFTLGQGYEDREVTVLE